MPPSHSRRADALPRLLAVLWLATGLAAGSARAQPGDGCAPFDEAYPAAQASLSGSSAGGIAPVATAQLAASAAAAAGSGGGIIELPDPPRFEPETLSGEVLLALPKDDRGALPEGTRLGEGARIAASFFSPVLCATVARVVGPEGATAKALVPELPDTAMVVPNTVYFTAQAELRPVDPVDDAPAREATPLPSPDPYRIYQYGLEQSGAQQARGVSDGSGVRVAVLDSAPQATHRDLAAVRLDRFEGGPGEAAAVHGTLVSGVIAATENNGFGMAGVAPGAQLLAIPVCTPAGATAADRCTLYDLLRGVDHAWARGARILNLSIVGPANPLLERSMSRLDQLDVLVVASAGNEGTDAPRYPAAYPSVIGVGASNRERQRHAGSNHGPSAEILAPGVEILSAVPGDAFAFGSGTSLASAHVSGVLGILLGAGAEPATARAALFQTAVDGVSGEGPVLLPTVCAVLARIDRACP